MTENAYKIVEVKDDDVKTIRKLPNSSLITDGRARLPSLRWRSLATILFL